MDWQPIETAPKDGTMVDLWVTAFHGKNCRLTDMWWSESTGWRGGRRSEFNEAMAKRATYWMPLPPPPKENE